MNAAPLALLAVTAALVAMAGSAAADEGTLSAQAVEYNDPAHQEGRLALFAAIDSTFDGVSEVNGARPWLDLQAATMVAVEYEESRPEAAVPGSPVPPTQGAPTEAAPVTNDYAAAHAYLTEFQPGFRVHVYSPEGTLAYTMETSSGRFIAADAAALSRAGLTSPEDATATTSPDNFAHVERPGPWILHYYDSPAQLQGTLHGDFTIEIMGVTLAVEGDGEQGTVRSGTWTSPLDPNAPPQSAGMAYTRTDRFARLEVTDAILEVAIDGGAPTLRWASSEATNDFSGRAALVDAYGTLQKASGDKVLEHDRYLLDEGSRVSMLPQEGQRLGLEVSPTPVGTRGGVIASVPAPASAALLGTGAVLALAIAVGIGLLRRLLRLPALADVETAIEEGEYRKAARLAGRILSRLPGSEEALLGRAIALSKAGRHQDVVTELTQHLALRPASDGSLHYVLGLAQLESGKAAEGHASLREAVRLTPSLQAEVAPRLGKAFSVAQPTTRDTHGYA